MATDPHWPDSLQRVPLPYATALRLRAAGVADAVIAKLTGLPVNPEPIIANTCYSFVSESDVVHVASVHKWNAEQKTLVAVQGAGGLSSQANALEGQYARSWAKNIWADALL